MSDDTLDAAWKEAEAALPEGWRLTNLFGGYSDWQAHAEPTPAYRTGRGHYGAPSTTWLGVGKHGPTPAAALRALAAALSDTPEAET